MEGLEGGTIQTIQVFQQTQGLLLVFPSSSESFLLWQVQGWGWPPCPAGRSGGQGLRACSSSPPRAAPQWACPRAYGLRAALHLEVPVPNVQVSAENKARTLTGSLLSCLTNTPPKQEHYNLGLEMKFFKTTKWQNSKDSI